MSNDEQPEPDFLRFDFSVKLNFKGDLDDHFVMERTEGTGALRSWKAAVEKVTGCPPSDGGIDKDKLNPVLQAFLELRAEGVWDKIIQSQKSAVHSLLQRDMPSLTKASKGKDDYLIRKRRYIETTSADLPPNPDDEVFREVLEKDGSEFLRSLADKLDAPPKVRSVMWLLPILWTIPTLVQYTLYPLCFWSFSAIEGLFNNLNLLSKRKIGGERLVAGSQTIGTAVRRLGLVRSPRIFVKDVLPVDNERILADFDDCSEEHGVLKSAPDGKESVRIDYYPKGRKVTPRKRST